MTAKLFAAGLAVLVAFGCKDQPLPTGSSDGLAFNSVVGPVVNFVSVGGDDLCKPDYPPGCDANASLVARKYANGSVTGEWHDNVRFEEPQLYQIHITIDCLFVDGNQAWVSGVVTGGPYTGWYAIERVADNGRSANEPVDRQSFIHLNSSTPFSCEQAPLYPLYDMIDGQVTVR